MHSRTARLVLGDECLDITKYETPGKPYFADSRANDRWFQHIAIEVADMPAAYARLREAHVALVSGSPQTLPEWNIPAAGISALYFRDPDGHYLELIHFPAGQRPAEVAGRVGEASSGDRPHGHCRSGHATQP